MKWTVGDAYYHEGALMTPARPGHHVNTVGGKPLPPTVPPVQHSGDVAVLEQIAQEHSIVQEGGGE